MTTKTDVVHAYRHLYRGLLRAVQFSSPARYVARDQLRAAFREAGAVWDAEAAKRTLWFVEAAARERGLEHRVLKNLLAMRLRRVRRVGGWRWREQPRKPRLGLGADVDAAMQHYDMTVAMLNRTMGLRLR